MLFVPLSSTLEKTQLVCQITDAVADPEAEREIAISGQTGRLILQFCIQLPAGLLVMLPEISFNISVFFNSIGPYQCKEIQVVENLSRRPLHPSQEPTSCTTEPRHQWPRAIAVLSNNL